MRLLHTTELRFQDFPNDALPRYQILSHRWIGDEEISYPEFIYLNRHLWAGGQVLTPLMVVDDDRRNSPGYHKIMNFRAESAKYYQWCWVDTVCIDKSSSAELSEAVNSMFHWYQRAAWCNVYLADVVAAKAWLRDDPSSFINSMWFKRGWTLQEELAPLYVSFWDANWKRLGTEVTLQEQITAVTGIPGSFLRSWEPWRIHTLSRADRMALAIGRETTSREDRAYSLLGLFEVNMPLLYGEGDEAFRRLQETIIQRHSTSSLFVHKGKSLLADSVDDFAMHNGPQYLARRQNAIDKGYLSSYMPRYANEEVRVPGTWAKAVNNRGVEMQATYLEVENSNEQFSGFEYRLIILEYANIEHHFMPTFILVYKTGRSRTWTKVGLLDDQGLLDVGKKVRDDLDFPHHPGGGETHAAITDFRRQIRNEPKMSILKFDLMIVN